MSIVQHEQDQCWLQSAQELWTGLCPAKIQNRETDLKRQGQQNHWEKLADPIIGASGDMGAETAVA